jgi:23S rRNA (cytosine1962-C5)-methyltransferase
LLSKGGLPATFSCSGAMNMETFKQVFTWVTRDTGIQYNLSTSFASSKTHPVRAPFPEGGYLKGLLCRVF